MAASVLAALRLAVVEPGLLVGLAAEAVEHGGQLVNQGILGADIAMGQGAASTSRALGKILAGHQRIAARCYFFCPATFRTGVDAGEGAYWHA